MQRQRVGQAARSRRVGGQNRNQKPQLLPLRREGDRLRSAPPNQEAQRGERIAQETHLWDPERQVTRPMRSKEYANDYRYFPGARPPASARYARDGRAGPQDHAGVACRAPRALHARAYTCAIFSSSIG